MADSLEQQRAVLLKEAEKMFDENEKGILELLDDSSDVEFFLSFHRENRANLPHMIQNASAETLQDLAGILFRTTFDPDKFASKIANGVEERGRKRIMDSMDSDSEI